ncbi:MAG TPA: 16S rRNA (cytidine(1402)-2'-O)-methyltransferase [Vicinamibacterales bacterium]|nr:16S rRNA (cytidine(1402)-2'-O)-methyltransferase [Vicinamibacterales bacterium]
MSGTLFVVATPLGNMEDVTFRAIRVLREVDLIAAEDTRRTARLLSHYAISTSSVSFHQHNVRTRVPQLLSRLEAGKNVALVTDAGTPGVSDPGVELVGACIKAQIAVDPIPGASAPLVAAVASGFPLIPLTIFGFPPRRSKDRTMWFSRILAISHTVTFFESPHRIAVTLSEARSILGERQIMIGRELTKRHQEFLRGTAGAVLDRISEPKGEITIVVGPANTHTQLNDLQRVESAVADAVEMFGRLTNTGLSRRAALSEAARAFSVPARVVYAAVEEAKRSVE